MGVDEHSLSPILHNYWFKKYKIDEYSTISISEEKLPGIIEQIKNQELVELMSLTLQTKNCNLSTPCK